MYTVTARVIIKVESETPEQASEVAKAIVDDALYDYVTAGKTAEYGDVSVSKAKTRVWVNQEST